MNDDLISIVLPVYNGRRHLAEAIESCMSQTCNGWELIVVDDASTDDSAHIIESYSLRDPRIACIRHATNRKLPAALNTGFARARGKWFTWISDDNRFHPDALHRMKHRLNSTPGLDGVYTDVNIIDDNGNFIRSHQARDIAALGFRGNVVGSSFLYHRDMHATVGGFPEDLFLVEDYYFWLRAADRFHLHHLDTYLYDYREHSASLSSRHPDRRTQGRIALLRALEQTTSKRLQAGIHVNLASDNRPDGFSTQVLHHIRTAFRTAPLATLRHAPFRYLIMG